MELNAAIRLLAAQWWDQMSPEQQKKYIERHPKTRKNQTQSDALKRLMSEPLLRPVPKEDKPAAEKAKDKPVRPAPQPKKPEAKPAKEQQQPTSQIEQKPAAATKPAKGKTAHKAATPEGLDEAHKQAIKEYTGSMYLSVNQALRKGKPIPAEDRKEMKLVDEAFSKAKTTEPLEVYRGIGPTDADMFANLKVGDSYQDKGFVSTSTDVDTADNFSRGENPTILHVQVPKGSKAISVDSMSVFKQGGHAARSENEILLNRGASYKVLSIKPGKRGQPRVVTVEYTDGQG